VDDSIIEIDSQGLNIFLIDNNNLIVRYINYETFIPSPNHINYIVKDITDAYNNKNIYLIIIIAHYNSISGISKEELANKLNFIGMNQFRYLNTHNSYFLVYNNKDKILLDEKYNNGITDAYFTIMNRKSNMYVVVCQNTIYKFFREYIESFIKLFKFDLLLLSIPENYTYTNELNKVYLFCQTIPNVVLNTHTNICLINTEQPSQSHRFDYYYSVLKKNIKVIDYNNENIVFTKNKIMKSTNDVNLSNIIHMPYCITKNEIKRLTYNKNKIYDVAWCGYLDTTRRNDIIETLKQHNISIKNISGWNNLRDSQIHECKILLNIHVSDEAITYESLRCDRIVASKMLVVSEDSEYRQMVDIKELVIFEKYNNIVNKIIEIVNNYDKYYNEFIIKYDKYLDNIINERKQKILINKIYL